MKQPLGYEDPAPRAWFKRLHDFLCSAGFMASKTDVSLFYHTAGESKVFLLVYVDDIIILGNDALLLDKLLARLSGTFKIRDLGAPGFFLGIETVSDSQGLILSQRRYMNDILSRAVMLECKALATLAATTQPVTPTDEVFDNLTQYRRIVGALQYLTITRPDLSYAVNRLCQFMHSPTAEHWCLLKRVLRYVKGTQLYGLRLHSCMLTLTQIGQDVPSTEN
ncbi:uncharacterized protein LOC116006835 [Ipomoea triloba]|uniref:uncharacterized protein LOC116006835 n=1 Tax=Ipomoea triloba TaxID=35885 RepID=UPI00125CFC74|nr:uncharacterized protein LOC116006835 [Ipomoea triloba]